MNPRIACVISIITLLLRVGCAMNRPPATLEELTRKIQQARPGFFDKDTMDQFGALPDLPNEIIPGLLPSVPSYNAYEKTPGGPVVAKAEASSSGDSNSDSSSGDSNSESSFEDINPEGEGQAAPTGGHFEKRAPANREAHPRPRINYSTGDTNCLPEGGKQVDCHTEHHNKGVQPNPALKMRPKRPAMRPVNANTPEENSVQVKQSGNSKPVSKPLQIGDYAKVSDKYPDPSWVGKTVKLFRTLREMRIPSEFDNDEVQVAGERFWDVIYEIPKGIEIYERISEAHLKWVQPQVQYGAPQQAEKKWIYHGARFAD